MPKLLFFDEKKIRKIRIIFDIESPIFRLFHKVAKLGKASWDAYNQGGWLISKDLLKNWIAEGVASELNDSQ